MNGFLMLSLGLLGVWALLVLAPPRHPWNSIVAMMKAGGFVLLVGTLAAAMWCVAFVAAQARGIAPRAASRREVSR